MTDSEIIAAFALDENQGMRALIQTHTPKLFALIRPIVGSQSATDEVLQRVAVLGDLFADVLSVEQELPVPGR